MRFLDYQKVRDSERAEAASLFGAADAPSSQARKIMGLKSQHAFDGSSGSAGPSYSERAATAEKSTRVKLTEKEKRRVEVLIRNAKSLQEIARLEKEINEGRVPREAMDLDGE